MVLKTWTNGWATSHRFHEANLLKCIFGCRQSCPDSLTHYLWCPRLWAPIFQRSVQIGESIASDTLLERLCIVSPTLTRIRSLVCAFLSYHALRLDYSGRVGDAQNSQDFSEVLDKHHEILGFLCLSNMISDNFSWAEFPQLPTRKNTTVPARTDRSEGIK